ncbi:MAG: hypothetical protein ABIM42_03785 [candidate division WOR-3 bacterium]
MENYKDVLLKGICFSLQDHERGVLKVIARNIINSQKLNWFLAKYYQESGEQIVEDFLNDFLLSLQPKSEVIKSRDYISASYVYESMKNFAISLMRKALKDAVFRGNALELAEDSDEEEKLGDICFVSEPEFLDYIKIEGVLRVIQKRWSLKKKVVLCFNLDAEKYGKLKDSQRMTTNAVYKMWERIKNELKELCKGYITVEEAQYLTQKIMSEICENLR